MHWLCCYDIFANILVVTLCIIVNMWMFGIKCRVLTNLHLNCIFLLCRASRYAPSWVVAIKKTIIIIVKYAYMYIHVQVYIRIYMYIHVCVYQCYYKWQQPVYDVYLPVRLCSPAPMVESKEPMRMTQGVGQASRAHINSPPTLSPNLQWETHTTCDKSNTVKPPISEPFFQTIWRMDTLYTIYHTKMYIINRLSTSQWLL